MTALRQASVQGGAQGLDEPRCYLVAGSDRLVAVVGAGTHRTAGAAVAQHDDSQPHVLPFGVGQQRLDGGLWVVGQVTFGVRWHDEAFDDHGGPVHRFGPGDLSEHLLEGLRLRQAFLFDADHRGVGIVIADQLPQLRIGGQRPGPVDDREDPQRCVPTVLGDVTFQFENGSGQRWGTPADEGRTSDVGMACEASCTMPPAQISEDVR